MRLCLGMMLSLVFGTATCHLSFITWLLRIKAPIWLLRVITFFGEYAGRLTGKISALNNDKYNIMKQRNWRCDITPTREELVYHPEYDLARGVRLTIQWYKDNKWL